jgi:CspA family cold shock protein
MTEGTVKFFNMRKNFGFITGDDGKDYFVHTSGLAEGTSLGEGDKVSFEIVEGDKGEKAEKVKKL